MGLLYLKWITGKVNSMNVSGLKERNKNTNMKVNGQNSQGGKKKSPRKELTMAQARNSQKGMGDRKEHYHLTLHSSRH